MGNHNTCKNIKIKNCLDAKEVDFEIIDVKKKFIRRKLIDINDIDKKFYRKIENNNNNKKIFTSINTRNDNDRNNPKFDHLKNSKNIMFSNIPRNYYKNDNDYLHQIKTGAFIQKSSSDSLTKIYDKNIGNKFNSSGFIKNCNKKKEYYNGSVKVITFNDKYYANGPIAEITENSSN